jgi:Uma2 family endonuclease
MPPLEEGDHLDQKTFHERYEAMPEGARAELVGGIVFMPSPLKMPHSGIHARVVQWQCGYVDRTPGTGAFDNTSTILDEQNEPQPDVCLLILAPAHRQTLEENGYIIGAPEHITEVAPSSVSIDLHRKRNEYERAGVKEYVVVVLRQQRVIWWVNRNGRLEELAPGADGIYRSEVFPGLWLDLAALLRQDGPRLLEVLRQGMSTPEHATFVARLVGP